MDWSYSIRDALTELHPDIVNFSKIIMCVVLLEVTRPCEETVIFNRLYLRQSHN